jgi:hypothetical protein
MRIVSFLERVQIRLMERYLNFLVPLVNYAYVRLSA